MIKKYLSSYLCLGFLLVVSGCSDDGGGGDTPTNPNTVFQLFPSEFFTTGSSTKINLTGSDTTGGVLTGFVAQATGPQTTFLGEPAVQVGIQLEVEDTVSGWFFSVIDIRYYSTSAADRHYLGFSDPSTTTVSATTSAIPQTAKIGDFGNIGTYTDNAGNVDVKSWRLDDGFNGRAEIVELSTERDQFDTVTKTSTTTTVIDRSGKMISIELVVFFASSGETRTLRGSQ